MGIEALSRGAAHCTFVERDRAALRALRANLDAPRLDRIAPRVVERRDGVTPAMRDVDLALVDPPYSFDGWPLCCGRCRSTTFVRGGRGPIAQPTVWDTVRGQAVRPHVGDVLERIDRLSESSQVTLASVMTTVLYPRQLRPLHLGHLDVVEQALELFGDVVVGDAQPVEAERAVLARRAARDDRRGRARCVAHRP
jgi:hypothetical protein